MIGARLIKLCGVAVICAVCALVLKRVKSGLAFAVGIGAGIVISLSLIQSIEPIITQMQRLMELGGAFEYAEPMLKAIGVAVVTQIAVGICSECEEKSIANGIELAGRVEILVLCLPLLEKIIGYAIELISFE